MSKFDRKELSPRVMGILKLIEDYAESRHTCGTRFINGTTHVKWDYLEDALSFLDEISPDMEIIKKAERYDWLRSQPNDTTAPRIDIVFWEPEDESANCGTGLRLEEADRKIDEAMKTSN